jgi:hypothetical protein
MFYSRHSTILYRLLFPIIEDQGLAEDLISEVFLSVWRQAGSVREGLVGVGLVGPDRVVQARRTRHDNTQRKNACKNWFVFGAGPVGFGGEMIAAALLCLGKKKLNRTRKIRRVSL